MLKPKAPALVAFGAAMAMGLALAPAHAQNIRDCGTTSIPTTTDVTPPNSSAGFTQTTTTTTTKTQTPACNSNSTTNQEVKTTTSTGPVVNKAGNAPGGHQ
jgi:hypothetical protein